MYFVLLHVSEFGSLVSSGHISIYLNRIKFINDLEIEGLNLLLEAPYIRLSEPEAYVVANIDPYWRENIGTALSHEPTIATIRLKSVVNFSAITSTAQKLLSSRAERLFVKFGSPVLEKHWEEYCRRSEFYERKNSSENFIRLFGGRFSSESYKKPDLSSKDLLTKTLELRPKSDLEKSYGLAKYGVFEFSIRLSNEFSPEWRQSKKYEYLKKVREELLADKTERELHFLDVPEVCCALQELSDESKNKLGYEPLALACFYQCMWHYDLHKKIAIEEIYVCAKLLIEWGMTRACGEFLTLIGFFTSPEDINLLLISIIPIEYPSLSHPVGQFAHDYFNLDLIRQSKNLDNYLDAKSSFNKETIETSKQADLTKNVDTSIKTLDHNRDNIEVNKNDDLISINETNSVNDKPTDESSIIASCGSGSSTEPEISINNNVLNVDKIKEEIGGQTELHKDKQLPHTLIETAIKPTKGKGKGRGKTRSENGK